MAGGRQTYGEIYVMAKAQQKSRFLSKIKPDARKAFEETVGKEAEFTGFSDLPPNINGGVARLVDCNIRQVQEGKDNAGEYYFYAAGVCVQPKEFEGQITEGGRTSIIEPLYDTPDRSSRKAQGEHLAWVVNELKKLGAPTDLDLEDLEEVCEDLVAEKPYFKFRTWKGAATDQFPDPRVQHQWQGKVAYETTAEDDVEDGTGAEEVEESAAPTKPAKAPARTPAPAGTGKKPPTRTAQAAPEPEEEPEEDFDEFSSLSDLAAKADDRKHPDSKKAQKELMALAKSAGVGDDDVENADDWAAVAGLIKEAGSAAEGEEEEEEEAEEPAAEEAEFEAVKGDVYLYRPTVNGKKGKPVQCEAVAVYAKRQTADLKNLDNPTKVYKGVLWDDLEPVE